MKFWVRWLVLWLLLGVGLRVGLLTLYPPNAAWPGLVGFIAGLFNDLQAFFILAGCVALCGFVGHRTLRVAAFVSFAVMLLVLVVEVFFWIEFERRPDRLVFHYLAYPKEVVMFLEDQFYLSLFIVPFVVLTWLTLRLVGRPTINAQSRSVHVILALSSLLVLVGGKPLGQSNTRVASEFASNGYLGVLDDAKYPVDDVPWLRAEVDEYSAKTVALRDNSVARQMRNQAGAINHVVLIIEESFAGEVWEDETMRAQYLPHFSALAKESVVFTRLYATGSRTTRGMEALLNGFPPLPGISTTERAGFERLPSLARGMAHGGFHPVFMYGGWPGFSNFSNYWHKSGFQKIWSREDFDGEFETSWGVADGALFNRLHAEMNALTQQHKQVFVATLTVSHHRPYDFPKGTINFPEAERKSEYAMAYADKALGDFFAAAQRSSWYPETLFIVAADHGLHASGDALIPASSYHIPLLMHSAQLEPRVFTGLGSAMSLPKTLMNLLNIQTSEAFAGEDLLCACDSVVPMEFGYHIGLLEPDGLKVLRSDGEYVAWAFDVGANRVGSTTGSQDVQALRRIRRQFAPSYKWYYSEEPRSVRAESVDYAGEISRKVAR